ncbi:MAG: T9SS type A sorting domain-containing protein [Calditrichae bacterium]|nr:T9SS type A sorting domain-containing protein [Calditrichia bacterium]
MVSATQGTVNLTWEESVDADFDYFSVYRSDNPDALGSLVGTTTGIEFVEENVPNGDWYYQISATDFNGNEGDYTVASIVVGIGDDNNLPNEFSLEQNYPNPFNPSTSIEFALPQTVDVSLKIYNIRGQLVKTLVDGSKSAGRYSLTWDGTDNFGSRVASGTYIYSIKAGEFVNNKKMVLLK